MKKLLAALSLVSAVIIGSVVFAQGPYGTTAGKLQIQFGSTTDIPVVGDYDDDGESDMTVFRPSTGQWYMVHSSRSWSGATASYSRFQWGAEGDIPVPSDYDADGTTDLVVYRPSTGTWYVALSGGTPWHTRYDDALTASGGALTDGSAVAILD